MDPQANVVEANCLAREIADRDFGGNVDGFESMALRLAELFLALHEWRLSGGFDPFADPDAPVANPQANALLHRVKVNVSSHVGYIAEDAWSMAGYVIVTEHPGRGPDGHAFECGIAPDGRVSS